MLRASPPLAASISSFILLLLLVAAAPGGCDDGEASQGADATDTVSAPEVVELSGVLQGDRTLSADKVYVIKQTTYISQGTLTIEPGTVIYGEPKTALVIARSAKINAVGTATSPIIFTSAVRLSDPTAARAPGDWGGVALLGNAPANSAGGVGVVDGLDADERYGTYGGTDTRANCGTLRYARIEFAGAKIDEFLGFNGLTVAGCSAETTIDHVQVHAAAEDGLEVIGGSADFQHVVISHALEDSLDFSFGWHGNMQYVLIKQASGLGDAAIEGDNHDSLFDATPRSAPVIYNATLIGAKEVGGQQVGAVLRRGSGGTIANSAIMGFPTEAIDIRDAESAALVAEGVLSVDHVLFYDNGPDGQTANNNDTDSFGDDDGGFDENAALSFAVRANIFNEDPKLPSPFGTPPSVVPPADSPLAAKGLALPSDSFFDKAGADFYGAFAPGGEDWTAGWTDYPTQ